MERAEKETIKRDIGAVAIASYTALKQGQGKALGDVNRNGAGFSAAAAGVVDLLVDRAARLAPSVIVSGANDAAAQVWRDAVDILGAMDLTPVLYCTKSGRALGAVDPAPWQDYLAQIAALGETKAGENCLRSLVAALVAQKAHCIAPMVLTSSADNLALIRETSPADYLARSLGDLFPMPKGAQSDALALRAEKLGQSRAMICVLPSGAVQYACEVVTLYLSYIRPALLPFEADTLAHYGKGALADISAPFQSVATVSHFCARIVQSMLTLLTQSRLRPLDRLRPRDLSAIRIQYQGLAHYDAAKKAREKLRRAKKSAYDAAQVGKPSRAQAMVLNAIGGAAGDFLSGFADAFLSDAIALSVAAGVSGRKLPVMTDSEIQAQAALDRQAGLKLIRAQSQDAEFTLDLLDLAELVAGGAVDEFTPEYENDSDLVAWGLLDAVDLDALDGDLDDIDPLDDPDGESVLPDWLISDAMRDASPKNRAPAKKQKPVDPAVAAAIAAMQGQPMRQQIAPAPAPVVTRRMVASPAPSAHVATAPIAAAVSAPAGIIRRRLAP